MKLLITSDVHGQDERLAKVIKRHKDVDYHLNAGDMCLDEHIYKKYHIITVKGNNDFYSNEPYKRVLELEGLKVFLTHGHIEHVKYSLNQLISEANQVKAKLVIFGHTHQRYLNEDQHIKILNPGALGDFHKSYAIYENGQITFYEL
jgi:putative phosphoesterase